MSSTFSGLNTALSALQAQRRGLDVTGQNIANANTDGYSRQRVDLQAVGGSTIPAMYAIAPNTAGGVATLDVTRIQDTFLEAQGRAEHAQNAYLADQQVTYSRIEMAYGEPSDTALLSQLSDFWSSMHGLTNNPGDLAARTQALGRGTEVATGLRAANDSLTTFWNTTRTQLDMSATAINTSADSIGQLNQAILRASSAGLPANELSDQRDTEVRKLAEMTGASAAAQSDGTVNLYLSGSSLVNGSIVRHVQPVGATAISGVVAAPAGLRWQDNSSPAIIGGGAVGSALQTLNTVIPASVARLDTVAVSLATAVNTQHQLGYDLNGNPGKAFFTGTGPTITAATIGVAITDPRELAASASAGVDAAGNPVGNLDGSNADKLASLATGPNSPDATYRALVADLGVASQAASRQAGIQASVTKDIDSARLSQSGVSLDEEMTNMLSYQRAYEAAGRLLTTLDGVLDTLINHTGRG